MSVRFRVSDDIVVLRIKEGQELADGKRQSLERQGFREARRGPTTWDGAGYAYDIMFRRRRSDRPVAWPRRWP
jgi:hypothetical protein